MTGEWLNIFAAPSALAVNMTAQLLSARHGAPLLKSVFTGFAAGLAAVVACAAFSPAGDAAANLAIYAALGYSYFHFVNLGETARRIRLMRELHDSPAPLTRAELQARYPPAEMLELRIQRLVRAGQLREENGRLYVTGKAVSAMAGLLVLAKLLYLGRDRERLE
ncbi:MAG: hypothetical protein PHW69_05280 [Elusimicrobiaceae bacterium]|nr:hypothetical protein [Elusimicrobiaceae bacterium]